jgi:peptidoglycan/xylan/chitin deacetylase (PgdA/CDA1 family)
MKNIKNFFVTSIILLVFLTSCQQTGHAVFFLSKPSLTPTLTSTSTATVTPTPTVTPTSTSTPTITPTATPAFVTVQQGNITVPILLYHHVTADITNSRYNIDPAVFDEQMKWLSEKHYTTITISQVADLILHGGQMPLRPVVITFDDGNLDIYQNAYPILQKYGFTATFYIVNQYINGRDMISTVQIKELIQKGWEIGSHSEHHTDLTSPGADLETEIRLSKLHMEDRLGVPINTFAYPFGSVNDQVISKTMNAGYTSAVGLGESIVHGYYDIFYLNRMEIEGSYSMEKFISMLPWSGSQ